jgi:hypothetical protein
MQMIMKQMLTPLVEGEIIVLLEEGLFVVVASTSGLGVSILFPLTDELDSETVLETIPWNEVSKKLARE